MNKFREKPKEPIPIAIGKEKPRNKKQSRFARYFASLFSGSFLAEKTTLQQLPFIFFLTIIALCYVANGYYAERTVRKINQVTNDLKELKSEFITSKSELMFLSKQSELAKAALKLGIKESVTPPKKIMGADTTVTAAPN